MYRWTVSNKTELEKRFSENVNWKGYVDIAVCLVSASATEDRKFRKKMLNFGNNEQLSTAEEGLVSESYFVRKYLAYLNLCNICPIRCFSVLRM